MDTRKGTNVNFSELYKQSGSCVKWSFDGLWLAVANAHRLTIRDAETMDIVQLYTCSDTVDSIEWSPDSLYLLAVISKASMVQAWSVGDAEWNCKVSEGLSGCVAATWSPDSRHLITFSDFNLHMTIWSLIDKSAVYIKHVKSPTLGIDFSPDGKYMAVALRHDCKDFIGIFSTTTWEQLEYFKIDTLDVLEVKWSPDGSAIAARDSSLNYKLVVYSPHGDLLTRYVAYENALGIRCMSWAHNGSLLSLGSFDGTLRLLNTLTWRPVASFNHKKNIYAAEVEVVQEVLTEEADDVRSGKVKPSSRDKENSFILNSSLIAPRRDDSKAKAMLSAVGGSTLSDDTCYVTLTAAISAGAAIPQQIIKTPVTVGTEVIKGPPKIGVFESLWSNGDEFIATRCADMPFSVFIWKLSSLKLHAVLMQKSTVLSMAWDPCAVRLSVCCGNGKVYFWTPEAVSWVAVPYPAYSVRAARWNPAGHSMALVSKERVCVSHMASSS